MTWSDLGGNPYACESDVGRPRAESVAAKLAELNPYVRVTVMGAGASGTAVGSLHSADARSRADFLDGRRGA